VPDGFQGRSVWGLMGRLHAEASWWHRFRNPQHGWWGWERGRLSRESGFFPDLRLHHERNER